MDRRPEDLVAIRLMRPISVAVAACTHAEGREILPPPTPITFSRAEWSILVTSGLFHALGLQYGWRDWDRVTAFLAPEISEKDHLLVVASLFLQGYDFHGEHAILGAPYRAFRAVTSLASAAAAYRERENIQPPVAPWPTVLYFSVEGRLWFVGLGQELQNQLLEPEPAHPSFEAPLLEQAVEATHIETLMDLAKHGEEATFKELARTLGVAAERLDELWAGTIRRVKP